MADEGFKRKLAAILSADVEGYSRLMDDDEEATVRTITSYRNVITDLTQQFRGRVVDSPGDNILADFTSVVDAVNCAVEIQRDLAERNAQLPDNRKMQFRIGVNLGDVIDEDGRIYGDGVNIAARVESLAEAGGICISGRAHDQVENKLGLEFEDLGKHEVKNISRPIQVYRVLSYPGVAAHRVAKTKESLGRRWRNIGILAAVVVILVGGLVFWQFYLRHPDVEPSSVEKMAYPLPDKPSIAVLAFDNMSGDSSLEYFSDGITEQIISALSKIPNLFVIARNSSFTYKGKPVKVQQVSEDLGVRYVLEGSVRKADNRLRITAQLIDAITGHHLWSESYDRELKDIFAIQDEITMKILTAMQVQLTEGGRVRVRDQNINNLQAYLKILEGRQFYRQLVNELDIHIKTNSKAIMQRMIKKEITALVCEKKIKVVLLVDEASLMRMEVFAELHTICQFEKDSKPYLPIILAGQNNLIDKLSYRSSQPLASRIVARSHLQGTVLAAMEEYLKHHLSIAGVKQNLFDQTAITAIQQGSGGLFRKANHLARGALIAAAAQQCSVVNAEHVRLASTEIF